MPYPKHEQIGFEEALENLERKVKMFVFQTSADLHAGNDEKGTDTTDATHEDDSREEFDESTEPKVAEKEEGQTCNIDVSDTF